MSESKATIDSGWLSSRYIPEPNSGCWLWLGELNSAGYGRISQGSNHNGTRVRSLAHRVSYELAKGPIPEGLELDHLCRVRCCVNPGHLEPVTRSENNRRGDLMKRKGVPKPDGWGTTKGRRRSTHCKNGHELPPMEYWPNGHSKGCLVCKAEYAGRNPNG